MGGRAAAAARAAWRGIGATLQAVKIHQYVQGTFKDHRTAEPRVGTPDILPAHHGLQLGVDSRPLIGRQHPDRSGRCAARQIAAAAAAR
eukprot:4485159-Prymnesium_polylepis.1